MLPPCGSSARLGADGRRTLREYAPLGQPRVDAKFAIENVGKNDVLSTDLWYKIMYAEAKAYAPAIELFEKEVEMPAPCVAPRTAEEAGPRVDDCLRLAYLR